MVWETLLIFALTFFLIKNICSHLRGRCDETPSSFNTYSSAHIAHVWIGRHYNYSKMIHHTRTTFMLAVNLTAATSIVLFLNIILTNCLHICCTKYELLKDYTRSKIKPTHKQKLVPLELFHSMAHECLAFYINYMKKSVDDAEQIEKTLPGMAHPDLWCPNPWQSHMRPTHFHIPRNSFWSFVDI